LNFTVLIFFNKIKHEIMTSTCILGEERVSLAYLTTRADWKSEREREKCSGRERAIDIKEARVIKEINCLINLDGMHKWPFP